MTATNTTPGEGQNPTPSTNPLFTLGNIVATPGALAALDEANETALLLLGRHVTGDWGDLCEEDKAQNVYAVAKGARIFSNYVLSSGERLWIITEADRRVTTLLLPSEY